MLYPVRRNLIGPEQVLQNPRHESLIVTGDLDSGTTSSPTIPCIVGMQYTPLLVLLAETRNASRQHGFLSDPATDSNRLNLEYIRLHFHSGETPIIFFINSTSSSQLRVSHPSLRRTPTSAAMRSIQALLATTLAATTFSAIGCYSGGLYMPSVDVAKYHATRACRGYTENGQHIRGAFEGTYFVSNSESNLPATVCVDNDGWHIVMQITNKGGAKTIGDYECVSGLTEAVDCLYGGEVDTSNFVMR